MAKKQASYADYEVIVEDSGKIVVKQSGQVLANAKGALREIATAVGFAIDPKWNTQQAGSKLVDYLQTVSAPVAPSGPDPHPVAPSPEARSIAPKVAATPKNNDNPKEREELPPEEMKQLEEILKRLETLEARLAKLEKIPVSESDINAQVYVVASITGEPTISNATYIYKRDSEGSLIPMCDFSRKEARDSVYDSIMCGCVNHSNFVYVILPYLLLLSNGDFVKLGSKITNNSGDYTVREVRAFATQMDMEASDKATLLSLTGTIMAKYGRNGWCVGPGALLNGDGKTYPYEVVDFGALMNDYVARAGLLKQLPVPNLKDKSVEEKCRIASEYISSIVSYPMPPKERIVEDFRKACEEYDKVHK